MAKVTVLSPLKYDPKKPTAKVGQVVEVDDDEVDALVACGAIAPPEKPSKPGKE